MFPWNVLKLLVFAIGFLNQSYGSPEQKRNPVITTQPQVIIAKIGDDVVLPCNVENNDGDDVISWVYNENTTLFIDSHPIFVPSNKPYTVRSNHTLQIRKISAELYGNYTCEIPLFKLSITHTVMMPKETGSPEQKRIPIITTQPQVIIAQIGEDVVLPCNVENDSDEGAGVVAWKRNENIVLFIGRLPVSYNNLYTVHPNHTLQIRNISAKLYGNYSCEIPQFKLSITHTVMMPKETSSPEQKRNPIITTQPQVIIAQIGEDVLLPCKVENYSDEAAILWSYNEKLTLSIGRQPIVREYQFTVHPNYTLQIRKFRPELYGNYTCEIPQFAVYVSHYTVIPKSIGGEQINISETVVVESISAKKYVENLSELSLTCRTKGLPTPTISWFRKSSKNSVEVNLNSTSATYVIPRATIDDSGIYSCKADNGESSDVKSVTVTVIDGVAAESATVHFGVPESSITLCCVFAQPRNITWLKNGNVLPSNERFYTILEENKNCLVIREHKEEDYGTYTCKTEKNAAEDGEKELKIKTGNFRIVGVSVGPTVLIL